jgi:hypothetical protein
MNVINASFYTWTYSLPEWVWEAELAEVIATAASGEDSMLGADLAPNGASDLPVLDSLVKSLAGTGGESSRRDADEAPVGLKGEGRVEARPASSSATDSQNLVVTTSLPKASIGRSKVELPSAGSSVERRLSTVVAAPAASPPSADVAPWRYAPSSVERDLRAGGQWVLKGYRTHTAFAVVACPIKDANWYIAQEQSDYEMQSVVRARKGPYKNAIPVADKEIE